MLIAGSKFVGHDSSLVVINTSEKKIFASSVERYTNIKHDSVSPFEVFESEFKGSTFQSLTHGYTDFNNIDDYSLENSVAGILHDYLERKKRTQSKSYTQTKLMQELDELIASNISLFKTSRMKTASDKNIFSKFIDTTLDCAGVTSQNNFFLDHHTAHHLASIHTSQNICLGPAISFVSDGWGDGITSSCTLYKERLKYIDRSAVLFQKGKAYSIGELYADATQYIDFKRNSDEGRLEALAAFGKPNKDVLNRIKSSYGCLDGKLEPRGDIQAFNPKNFPWLFNGMNKEDIACTLQVALEDIILDYIKYHCESTGIYNVMVGGGVHANVTLNSKIYNYLSLKKGTLYIAPFMGDEGVAFGAAISGCLREKQDIDWIREIIMPFYGGGKHSIIEKMFHEGIKHTCHKYEYDLGVDMISQQLHEGRILALVQGESEFGPRALGHRSIIAAATNTEAVKLINNGIKKRPSWQPFCPCILVQEADRLFENYYLNPHMSCSFKMIEKHALKIPSSCHVDNSARVQFVWEETNQAFFDILTKLKQLTGYGVMLNTSFNKSGSVIPSKIDNVIEEFHRMNLDTLWVLRSHEFIQLCKK